MVKTNKELEEERKELTETLTKMTLEDIGIFISQSFLKRDVKELNFLRDLLKQESVSVMKEEIKDRIKELIK